MRLAICLMIFLAPVISRAALGRWERLEVLCHSNDFVALVEMKAVSGPDPDPPKATTGPVTNSWTCRVYAAIKPRSYGGESAVTFFTVAEPRKADFFSLWERVGKERELVMLFLKKSDEGRYRLKNYLPPIIALPEAFVERHVSFPPSAVSDVDAILDILWKWIQYPGGSKSAAMERLWFSPTFRQRLRNSRVRSDFVSVLKRNVRNSCDSYTVSAAFHILGEMNESSVLDHAIRHGMKPTRGEIEPFHAVDWICSMLYASSEPAVKGRAVHALRLLKEKGADARTRRQADAALKTHAEDVLWEQERERMLQDMGVPR